MAQWERKVACVAYKQNAENTAEAIQDKLASDEFVDWEVVGITAAGEKSYCLIVLQRRTDTPAPTPAPTPAKMTFSVNLHIDNVPGKITGTMTQD